jgi:beta-lactamase regulating signal transducer with metallopeptidase domain
MSSIELWVTSWVLDVSIKATLLALAAWAGMVACRVHSSDVKHRVWLFVLGGMLLLPAIVNLVPGVSLPTWLYPPLQAAAVSGETGGGAPLVSPQQPAAEERSLSAPPEPVAALPLGEREPATHARDAVSHGMAEQEPQEAIVSPLPAPSANAVPPVATRAAGSSGFALAAIGVYLAGVGLLMVRLLVGTLQASRLVRRASQADLACSAAGLPPRTRIVESAELRVPVTIGYWRPVVVLPADWRTWSEPSLAMVLAHEGEHVRRRDTWVTLLAAFNVAVYWFHPVAWILRRRLLDLAEQACDDAVIQVTGSRNEYAQSLLDMAGRLTTTSGRLRPFGVAMARKASVVKRIEAIIDNDRPLSRKIGAVGALLLLCLMAPLVFLAAGLRATAPTVAAEAVAPAEKDDAVAKEEPRPAETADSTPQGNSLRVRVVDEAGKPIRGIRLQAKYRGHKDDYTTDAQGTATVVVPTDGGYLSLMAHREGYPRLTKWWRNDHGVDPFPAEFAFTFEQGRTIGGVVRDEQGKPIAGVQIDASIIISPKYAQSRIDVGLSPLTTDAQGRWHLDHVPQRIDEIWIRFVHPDYVTEGYPRVVRGDEMQRIESRTAVTVMKRGVPVSGTVTDPAGRPVANALVALGKDRFGSGFLTTRTDREGRYRFAHLATGETVLTVVSPGLAPKLRSVNVQAGMAPVDFRLEKGKTLRVRVVDRENKPVEGVRIVPDTWRGYRTLVDTGIEGKTDAEGRWTLTWAPEDTVELDILKRGYMNFRRLPLVSQDSEHVVTLSPPLAVSGRVLDAETKRPIPSFRLIQGYQSGERSGDIHWNRLETVEGRNGQYQLTIAEPSRTPRVRIEADGYQPGISREFKNDEGSVAYDFALRKGRNLNVAVRLPDGKPAAGAEACLSPEQSDKFINMALFVQSGRFSYPDHSRPYLTAGPDGRLSITPQENDFLLVVLHDQGYAQTTSQKLTANPQITLTAWARLEGVVRNGAEPVAGLKLFAHENNEYYPMWGFLNHDDQAESDAQGRFVFPKLKPGQWMVTGVAGIKDYGRMELAPGQTFTMNIGRTGRPLVGRIQWPGGRPPEGDLSRIGADVRPKLPEPPSPPKATRDQGPDAVRAWTKQWMESKEGRAWQTKAQQSSQCPQSVSVSRDGTLRMENAEPGQYKLGVYVMLKDEGMPWERPEILRYACDLSIPDIPGRVSDQPLDLGNLVLQDQSPKRLPSGPVKPPAPQAPGTKSVGSLRDQMDLLRYVVATYQENKNKIQTWQGKATVEEDTVYHQGMMGHEYSAKVQFVFDRARKSLRWNTTLEQWTRIEKGTKTPQPVPQVSNGMQTPEALYRLGPSWGSPVNPAQRPLTLTIWSPGVSSGGRIQPQLHDFNPLFYLETSRGDVARDLSAYLGWADQPGLSSMKVIREGDEVTIDMGGDDFFSRITLSLSQGCNPIRYESAESSGSTWRYRWTYELRDGIWLPKTWTETVRDKGNRDANRKVTFVENRVNQPVEPTAFAISRLGLQRGDRVEDRRTQQKYQYEGDR